MLKAALTSIDDLKNWYFSYPELPKFTIYAGRTKNTAATISRMDAEDKETGWNQIEQTLEMYRMSGGEFIVVIYPLNRKATSQMLEVNVRLSPAGQSSNNSINGASTLPLIAGKTQEDYIAQTVQDKMERYELQREVEDLQAALEEKEAGGPVQKIIGKIVDNPNFDQIATNFMAVLFSKFGGSGAQVSMQGIPPNMPADPIDGERIGAALSRIGQHFPDVHVFLESLATFIETNPEMAKSFFENNA